MSATKWLRAAPRLHTPPTALHQSARGLSGRPVNW